MAVTGTTDEYILSANENSKILVYYLSVKNFTIEEIDIVINNETQRLNSGNILTKMNCICIVIPIFEGESRIECINPNYITSRQLISKHQKLLKNLHKQIKENYEGK